MEKLVQTIDDLSKTPDRINLTKNFPLPHRSVFRRSWVWLGAYLFAVLVLLIGSMSPSFGVISGGNFPLVYDTVSFYVIVGGLVLCLGKLLYEEIYLAFYYYAVESGHIVVSKGIILKQRGSFTLTSITDVYLDRKLPDFMFALYNLHLSTPTSESGDFASVKGLGKATAVKLQDYLTNLIDAAHPDVRKIPHEDRTVSGELPIEEPEQRIIVDA